MVHEPTPAARVAVQIKFAGKTTLVKLIARLYDPDTGLPTLGAVTEDLGNQLRALGSLAVLVFRPGSDGRNRCRKSNVLTIDRATWHPDNAGGRVCLVDRLTTREGAIAR